MGAVDCLEMKTYEGKSFKIHCMKEPYYVMKLMESWMTLNNLEGANTKRYRKENGFRKSKQIFLKQPYGMHFRYRHQVDDHNNRRHAPISIKNTKKRSGLNVTSIGTWQYHLLMPILLMATLKRGVN